MVVPLAEGAADRVTCLVAGMRLVDDEGAGHVALIH